MAEEMTIEVGDDVPEYFNDITYTAEEDEEIDKLDLQIQEADEIKNEATANGGFNKQLAIEMEHLFPGSISEKRNINGYTKDHTRTHFEPTMESLTMESGVVKLALFAAFVGIMYKVVTWMFKSWKNNKEDCKAVTERMTTAGNRLQKIFELKRDVEHDTAKNGPAMVESAAAYLKDAQVPESMQPAQAIKLLFIKLYETPIRKIYSTYLDEVIATPNKHELIKTLAHNLPVWSGELLHAVGKLEKDMAAKATIDVASYKTTIKLAGKEGHEAVSIAKDTDEHYAKLTAPSDFKGDIPDPHHVQHANFYMNEIGALTPESLNLSHINSELNRLEAGTKGVELTDEQKTAATEVIRKLRDEAMVLTHSANVLVRVRGAATNLSKHFNEASDKLASVLLNICKKMASNDKLDELERKGWTTRVERAKGFQS